MTRSGSDRLGRPLRLVDDIPDESRWPEPRYSLGRFAVSDREGNYPTGRFRMPRQLLMRRHEPALAGSGCDHVMRRRSFQAALADEITPLSCASISSVMARSRWASSGSRRSEEHMSELQSLMRISYAVFRLKKTNKTSTIEERKST